MVIAASGNDARCNSINNPALFSDYVIAVGGLNHRYGVVLAEKKNTWLMAASKSRKKSKKMGYSNTDNKGGEKGNQKRRELATKNEVRLQ